MYSISHSGFEHDFKNTSIMLKNLTMIFAIRALLLFSSTLDTALGAPTLPLLPPSFGNISSPRPMGNIIFKELEWKPSHTLNISSDTSCYNLTVADSNEFHPVNMTVSCIQLCEEKGCKSCETIIKPNNATVYTISRRSHQPVKSLNLCNTTTYIYNLAATAAPS